MSDSKNRTNPVENNIKLHPNQEREIQEKSRIPEALSFLIQDRGVSLGEVARETKIPYQTLYSMLRKPVRGASLLTLQKLADYFGTDISVFCGLERYRPGIGLSEEETAFLSQYRQLTDDAQRRVLAYLGDMMENPKNLRNNSS